jgi:hypothetical protein
MIAAGLVEVWLGVNAEQKPLEEIATPLTAEDADQHPAVTAGAGTGPGAGQQQQRRRGRIEPALTPQAPYRLWSPMPPVYAIPLIDLTRNREVDEITAALAGAGTLERRRLARLVRADLWGRAGSPPHCVRQPCRARCAARAGACTRSCPLRRVPMTTPRPLITPSTATEPAAP